VSVSVEHFCASINNKNGHARVVAVTAVVRIRAAGAGREVVHGPVGDPAEIPATRPT
jgi:hypothetical protein